MKDLLQYRSQIYGFSALWIIFFHINNHFPVNLPILTPFLKVGNCGVDIFMFLSGYCLSLSFEKNSDIKSFYKKRIIRLIIPFLIISIPYYILKNFIRTPLSNGEFNLFGFFKDVIGESFFFEGLRTTWFVHAIFLMYIIFPILFKICKKNIYYAICVWISSYFILALLYLTCPNYYFFAIAACRLPVFTAGVLFSMYNIGPQINKRIFVLSVVYLIFFIFIFPIRKHLPQNFLWLFFFTFVPPIIYIVGHVCEKIKTKDVCYYVGLYSLEIYLIHVMILNILKWGDYIQVLSFSIYLTVPVLSFCLSLLVSKLSKSIANFIK